MQQGLSMTTRRRRSDAKTNIAKIVAAAQQEFARDGASATLSRIAEAAGVGDATLYRHFPNRQALAEAVYQEVFEARIKPAILALADAPAEAYIEALAELEEVMAEQRPLLSSLEDLAGLTVRLILRDRQLFDESLGRAQRSGNVRDDLSSEEFATFVVMLCTASVAMQHSEPARRRYLSLMIDALRPVNERRR